MCFELFIEIYITRDRVKKKVIFLRNAVRYPKKERKEGDIGQKGKEERRREVSLLESRRKKKKTRGKVGRRKEG